MNEATKEWLGIKPADFLVYAAFLLLIPAYYSKSLAIDAIALLVGGLLCLGSCYLGIKPHQDLGKVNNTIKLLAYPAFTVAFAYLAYLNFTSWA